MTFTDKTSTIFENSQLHLVKWFYPIWLMCADQSIKQISQELKEAEEFPGKNSLYISFGTLRG